MSSRSQRKSDVAEKPLPLRTRVKNSWVLLVRETLLKNNDFTIITLPHPATGKSAKYCLDNENHKVYEIVTFDESYRSWFIGESVKSDGSMQMLTPINPLFLVLPRLRDQCQSRAIPLEDLLAEKGFDKIEDYVTNLDSVADVKGPVELKAYKYNEEKTLAWLEDRVRKVARVLREKNIHVTPGVTSATFVASNVTNDDVNDEFYLKYAFGMISEYLEDDLMENLVVKFDFKPDLIESLGKKRKSEVEQSNDTNKKIKTENSVEDCKENIMEFKSSVQVTKTKPLTAKEKARQKAASGTKTLSAFFTKK